MDTSFLFDKSTVPSQEKIEKLMGDASPHWEAICLFLKEEFGEILYDWKYYGKKSGWTLKSLLKKRNLFFFKPDNGSFKVVFVFGEKAVNAVNESDLPDDIKEELNNARKYVEGRALRILVTGKPEDVETIKELVRIKVKN